MGSMGTMGGNFVGSLPPEARSLIADALKPYHDLKGEAKPEVYVGCSGNYAIDKIAFQRGFKVHANDVSLYSSLIGFIVTGRELWKPTLTNEELKPVLCRYGDTPRESLAKVMFAMAISGCAKRDNDYARMMWERYLQKCPDFMDATLEKFEKTDMFAFKEEDFFYGDFRDSIARAREQDLVIAFPPTYAGGYEKLYQFVDAAFDYPRPEYRRYDPAKADADLDEILTSKQAMIYTDRRYEGIERWLTGAIELGGGKHEIFLYSSFARRRDTATFVGDFGSSDDAPHTALLPFAYEPKADDHPSIRVVPSGSVLHYKRLFMSARVDYSKGEDLCLEFGLNGRAFGWASFSTMLGTKQKDTIFEVSDFVMNSSVRHLSKLLVKMLLSREAKLLVTRKFFTDYAGIQTSVYTEKPVSMKYRGVFQLLGRDEKAHKLTYVGYFNGKPVADVYAEWWKKEYGGGK